MSKGAFRPVSFRAVVPKQGRVPFKIGSFGHNVNTAIALGCGTKQASRDRLEEVVSARFHSSSVAVSLK